MQAGGAIIAIIAWVAFCAAIGEILLLIFVGKVAARESDVGGSPSNSAGGVTDMNRTHAEKPLIP